MRSQHDAKQRWQQCTGGAGREHEMLLARNLKQITTIQIPYHVSCICNMVQHPIVGEELHLRDPFRRSDGPCSLICNRRVLCKGMHHHLIVADLCYWL